MSASTPTALTADVYVVVQTPSGAFFSLLATGGVAPGVAPFAAGVALPTGFLLPAQPMLSVPLPALPPGAYAWLGALVAAGTSTLVSPLAQAPWTFEP